MDDIEGSMRPTGGPPAPAVQPRVPVWDLPVRVVHWSIVLLLAVLVPTGLAGGDWLAWHMRAGQTLIALVLFRVIWGFAGSPNARFRTFVRGPRLVARYARGLASRQKQAYATHNPLGAWMVLLLIAALLSQATTGLFTNDDVLWEGPLAKWVTKETSDLLSSFHRRFWWVLLALSAVHVAAALAYLVAFRDNLIGPMVTGRKRLPPGFADPTGAQASPVKALALAALTAIALWLVLHRL